MKFIGKWYYSNNLGDGQNLYIVSEDKKYYLCSYYYSPDKEYVAVWYNKNEFSFKRISPRKVHNDMIKVILPQIFE